MIRAHQVYEFYVDKHQVEVVCVDRHDRVEVVDQFNRRSRVPKDLLLRTYALVYDPHTGYDRHAVTIRPDHAGICPECGSDLWSENPLGGRIYCDLCEYETHD